MIATAQPAARRPADRRRGFTLVELLVVILIITLLTVITLPVILPAIQERHVNDAALLLQAAIYGAKDAAIRAGEPRGIRLLPDPEYPGPFLLNPTQAQDYIFAANRIITIQLAPDYTEGYVSFTNPTFYAPPINPPLSPTQQNLPMPANGAAYVNNYFTTLGADPRLPIVEGKFANPGIIGTAGKNTQLNPPTNWYWNIRQGETMKLLESGRDYVVAGPIAQWRIDSAHPSYKNYGGSALTDNPERFVNNGNAAVGIPTQVPPEVLFLVNAKDDDGDGYIDESFDGLDNDNDGFADPGFDGLDNDGDGRVDNPEELFWTARGNVFSYGEYEQETFDGPQFGGTFQNRTYAIHRRPVPAAASREITLPQGVVIDMTTLGFGTFLSERSRLPVNPVNGYVDILFAPSGEIVPVAAASKSALFSYGVPFYHFWLADVDDLYAPMWGLNGNQPNPNPGPIARNLLPLPAEFSPAGENRVLKRERRLVSLNTRSGRVTTTDLDEFDPNNLDLPYRKAQTGVREGEE